MCIRDRYMGQQVLDEAEVICTTCATSLDDLIKECSFDFVLIDEATMAIEPQCVQPFSRGASKIILVGDQKQLGPVVKSDIAKEAGLSVSLFERLIELGHPVNLLDTQYRMHPDISYFPRMQFYEGRIKNGVNEYDRRCDELRRLGLGESQTWMLDCKGMEDTSGAQGTSKFNLLEIEEAFCLIKILIKRCKFSESQIGLITGYKDQQMKMTEKLRKHYPNVEVKSVDGYQGREKDIIIISCVRTNSIGFLKDERRMNVALTRAKYGLFIIGDLDFLKKHTPWKELIHRYTEKNWVRKANFSTVNKNKN
eukprot:TRINITY_DN1000_c0_g1_i6.p1 TRINITY_DN1000_c0_g1~~TRINITY_DN1000_c0_g1_i6.p1  ORF type:complete len:309 (-),score=43.43 TRINITY_DN1000_c0_g1_i6:67-993(-)